MNDYEMIMVVPGIIGLAIACLSSGVSLESKKVDRQPRSSYDLLKLYEGKTVIR